MRAGVSKGIAGLSSWDAASKRWCGFDADLARAIAATLVGDASAVEFIPIAPDERCIAVASGQVDVGTFNASATLGREATHGVVFAQTMLYDSEALMIKASDMLDAVREQGVSALESRIVAVQRGATTSANLARDFGQREIAYSSVLSAHQPRYSKPTPPSNAICMPSTVSP